MNFDQTSKRKVEKGTTKATISLSLSYWEQKYELQKIKNAASLMKKRKEKFDGKRGRERAQAM